MINKKEAAKRFTSIVNIQKEITELNTSDTYLAANAYYMDKQAMHPNQKTWVKKMSSLEGKLFKKTTALYASLGQVPDFDGFSSDTNLHEFIDIDSLDKDYDKFLWLVGDGWC